MTEATIVVYGTTWCGDTRRARAVLDRKNIPYKWIDIDQNPEGRKFVEKVNKGYRSVPTIVFPDGSILVEPGENELLAKLG
ncbi:MAG TPA: glutaredoxin domain-containing protein [Anaerolineaceae bacterium]